jgi:FkbM family methyltransferase
MLEKHFAWNGILVEPSRTYVQEILKNRNRHSRESAVWKSSGKTLLFTDLGETGLSTLSNFVSDGIHGATRADSESDESKVSTISLSDLLMKYCAPKQIDNLSIDTESSELGILEAFDFNAFEIKLTTIEHNYDKTQ